MRPALAALALGLAALAMSAGAADRGKNSLDPVKGRFHQAHTQKLKLDCASCHADTQKDPLDARKDRPLPAGMPGPVDRHTCIACHQKPAKLGWYGSGGAK